jgi:hypothetical protein
MAERYPCRCCGYRTLDAAPPGSMSICPVCFWEDTHPDDERWCRSNAVDLRQAQRTFAAIGACEKGWLADVRPPTPEEARDPDWRTVDASEPIDRDAALAAIRDAFGGLTRGAGMRVYEAELADDYGHESARTALRRGDRYQRYWEIPDAVIAEHYSALSFFDPPAFRFHVAAYMSFALRNPDSPSNSPEFVVYALTLRDGALRAWCLERFAAFDDAQAAAVVAFLTFTARYDAYGAASAREALDGYWRARIGAAPS